MSKKVGRNIYIDTDLLIAVQQYAQEHDRSVSWAVRELVRKGLDVQQTEPRAEPTLTLLMQRTIDND